MSATMLIARRLEQRGFDFEIAWIFADEMRDRGRLANVSTDEAVELVAELMTPRGIFCDTGMSPRMSDRRSAAARMGNQTSFGCVDAYGSWLIA